MQIKQMLFAAAAGLAAQGVWAQAQLPGLWEHTIKMTSADGATDAATSHMEQRLAAMPPERRKQMEAAMARSGIHPGEGGSTVKVCITKEEAARPMEERMRNVRAQCTHKDVQHSGNTWKFKFDCTAPPSSGEGEMTYISDKAYAGKSVVTATRAGKTSQTTVEMSGKWLAADCGDVKPMKAPRELPQGGKPAPK